VAVDSAGNVYVGDSGNNTIRKVTPAGVVTTLAGLAGSAGSADGTGSGARFSDPFGVAVDGAGNIYVADRGNDTIRRVTPEGVVTTLAGHVPLKDQYGYPVGDYVDGTGSVAGFNYPTGIAVDSAGNVYVADTLNHTIRKVTSTGTNWVMTTLAGNASIKDWTGAPAGDYADGTGIAARFNFAQDVAVDSAGTLYVADQYNQAIRKVTPAGLVTTPAGLPGTQGKADGTGSAARFAYPAGVAVDSAGNVYVADSSNKAIRKVTPAGVVTTLAGLAGSFVNADGTGSAARFNQPSGEAVDNAGNVYVADYGNNTIRKVTLAGVVTTLAGAGQGSTDGTGSAARFNGPTSVAVDSTGNVYVADYGNHTIRKVTPVGVVTTLAGLAGSPGSADGTGSAARFGINGNFFGPFDGVAADSADNVYVADSGNGTIRKVSPAGVVTTLAGLAGTYGSADGTGSAARFARPFGVAVDSAGNVYVADQGNKTIRKVTPAGVVTTLAGLPGRSGSADGTGGMARFGGFPAGAGGPTGVAVDKAGNLYVADSWNGTIRKVTPAGVVATLAGLAGTYGSADGTGSAALFGRDPSFGVGPIGVAVDSAGNVYVADTDNNTIRKGYPPPMIPNSGSGFGFNGGQFGFNLTGPAGRVVVVEASTDLLSWLPLWTNTFAGTLIFSDSQSGVFSNRFYRARLP
jgi:sugar lactone lactonase YvrE